jgi:hypothetical protein
VSGGDQDWKSGVLRRRALSPDTVGCSTPRRLRLLRYRSLHLGATLGVLVVFISACANTTSETGVPVAPAATLTSAPAPPGPATEVLDLWSTEDIDVTWQFVDDGFLFSVTHLEPKSNLTRGYCWDLKAEGEDVFLVVMEEEAELAVGKTPDFSTPERPAECPMKGSAGPGPDHLWIPDDLAPGDYWLDYSEPRRMIITFTLR